MRSTFRGCGLALVIGVILAASGKSARATDFTVSVFSLEREFIGDTDKAKAILAQGPIVVTIQDANDPRNAVTEEIDPIAPKTITFPFDTGPVPRIVLIFEHKPRAPGVPPGFVSARIDGLYNSSTRLTVVMPVAQPVPPPPPPCCISPPSKHHLFRRR
jgi:hypothetical protein